MIATMMPLRHSLSSLARRRDLAAPAAARAAARSLHSSAARLHNDDSPPQVSTIHQRPHPPPTYIQPRCTPSSNTGRPSLVYWPKDKHRKRKVLLDSMIRVDHAGEFGAQKIYDGQLALLRNHRTGPTIDEMREQELDHLARLNRLIVERRVRPTALLPVWDLGGYALGFASAFFGSPPAMACTVAVEHVITEHYNDQLRELAEEDAVEDDDVRHMIRKHRDDEEEHADIGIEHEAEQTPYYEIYTQTIGTACKGAVYVAQRI